MTTVKQFKEGAKLEAPIYVHKPYVMLNSDDVVLWAGENLEFAKRTCYYDDCKIDIRRYDLAYNDNTKIEKPSFTATQVSVALLLGFSIEPDSKIATGFKLNWDDAGEMAYFVDCETVGDYFKAYLKFLTDSVVN